MKRRNVIILIILMVIGFAAIANQLIINGKASIGINSKDFDIYFSEALLDDNDISAQAISTDRKKIKFSTKILSLINDETTLDFEVTNDSRQFDATVTMSCKLSEEAKEYVNMVDSMIDQEIKAKTKEKGYITIALIKPITNDELEIGVDCDLLINAKERDKAGEEVQIDGKPDTYYNVGVTADTGGSVSENIEVSYGGTNTFTVTPSTGYYLSDIDCSSGYTASGYLTGVNYKGTQKVTVKNNDYDGAGSCNVSFSDKTNFDVIVSAGSGGSTSGNTSVDFGKSSTFTVYPNIGYYLSDITCSSGYTVSDYLTGEYATSSQKVTVKNNHTSSDGYCNVTFAPKKYNIIIVYGIGGTTSDNMLSIPYGGEAKFTVTPNTGYYLSSISCGVGYTTSGYSTGSSYTSKQTVTVKNNNWDGNLSCTVSFAVKNYSVSVSVGTGGSVSGIISGSLSVDYNSSNTFTVSANTGYYLSSISCGAGYSASGFTTGTNSSSSQTVTIKNNSYDGNGSCSISFSKKSYTLSASASPSLGGSVSGSSVSYGGSVTLYVSASSGYYLSSVYCSTGYSASGYTTGSYASSFQSVTVKNNNWDGTGSCTFYFTKK
ncbi:MAG: hypothetical protein J1F35_01725 [Erysipelotrichales bacterium]|nr:hypothetical protein [Erysipelotrichales bacterium]